MEFVSSPFAFASSLVNCTLQPLDAHEALIGTCGVERKYEGLNDCPFKDWREYSSYCLHKPRSEVGPLKREYVLEITFETLWQLLQRLARVGAGVGAVGAGVGAGHSGQPLQIFHAHFCDHGLAPCFKLVQSPLH